MAGFFFLFMVRREFPVILKSSGISEAEMKEIGNSSIFLNYEFFKNFIYCVTKAKNLIFERAGCTTFLDEVSKLTRRQKAGETLVCVQLRGQQSSCDKSSKSSKREIISRRHSWQIRRRTWREKIFSRPLFMIYF